MSVKRTHTSSDYCDIDGAIDRFVQPSGIPSAPSQSHVLRYCSLSPRMSPPSKRARAHSGAPAAAPVALPSGAVLELDASGYEVRRGAAATTLAR